MGTKSKKEGIYVYVSEKAMAPHSSTLAWKIPWTEEPGRLQSTGLQRLSQSDTTEWPHFHFSLSCIGEGNGTPLQCSCLENPRDGGAWWAAVYGVAQSQTRLKRLSSSSSRMSTATCLPWMSWQGLSQEAMMTLNAGRFWEKLIISLTDTKPSTHAKAGNHICFFHI